MPDSGRENDMDRQFEVVVLTKGGKPLRYPGRNIDKAVQLMETLASRGLRVKAFTSGFGVEEVIGLEELRGLIP